MSVAKVVRIDTVDDHPSEEAPHLSVLTIGNLSGVSQKIGASSNEHRYANGSLVVMMTKNAVLPEDVLKMGYWDPSKDNGAGRGMLAKDDGSRKNVRVGDKRFHSFKSEFITFPVLTDNGGDTFYIVRGDQKKTVAEGDDVMDFYGVREFVAP